VPRTVSLLENGVVLQEQGALVGVEDYTFEYQVPRGASRGELQLEVTASDGRGNTGRGGIELALVPDQPPSISLTDVVTLSIDGSLRTPLKDQAARDRGEYWVRVGGRLEVESLLADDVELADYSIWRLDDFGTRVERMNEIVYATSCPDDPKREDQPRTSFVFNRNVPTPYQIVVRDNFATGTPQGQTHEITREFVVRPLENMVPEIRLVSPAPDQMIAAGSFNLRMGLVATDDERLNMGPPMLSVRVNGVLVGAGGVNHPDLFSAATAQAFDSMYDSIEERYGPTMANLYGRRESPFAGETFFVANVPSGLIRFNEPVLIEVEIRDAQGAVGKHELTYLAAADEINPELVLFGPTVEDGVHEGMVTTARFKAFDNVKVEQIELFRSYALREGGLITRRLPYGTPLRTFGGIEAVDFEPGTGVNIDTGIFEQAVPVARIDEIVAELGGVANPAAAHFDLLLRFVVTDASGNRRDVELAFPIAFDLPPVVDIVAPSDGSRVVEGSQLLVNVNAHDDVSLSYVRVVATDGYGNNVADLRRVAGPYQFMVTVPARTGDPQRDLL
ncbi:MAG TPA: Ig-like domain-containing protein, partial [Ilumatobacteraceae bacterium]